MTTLKRTFAGHQLPVLRDEGSKYMSLHRSDWVDLGLVSCAFWGFSTQPRSTLALAFISKWQETRSAKTWHGIIFLKGASCCFKNNEREVWWETDKAVRQFRVELLHWLCEGRKKTYLSFSQNCLSLVKVELFLKTPKVITLFWNAVVISSLEHMFLRALGRDRANLFFSEQYKVKKC